MPRSQGPPGGCDNCHRERTRRRTAQVGASEIEQSLRFGLKQDLWTRVARDPGGLGVIDISHQSAEMVNRSRTDILGTDPHSLICQDDAFYYRAARLTLTKERPTGNAVFRLTGGVVVASFAVGTRFDDWGVREWLTVGIPVPTRFLPSLESKRETIRRYLCHKCEAARLCSLTQRLDEITSTFANLHARLVTS